MAVAALHDHGARYQRQVIIGFRIEDAANTSGIFHSVQLLLVSRV